MRHVLLLLPANRPRAQHRQSRLRPQRLLCDLHYHCSVHRLGSASLRSLLLASCLGRSFLHLWECFADILPPSWHGRRLSRHVPGLPRHLRRHLGHDWTSRHHGFRRPPRACCRPRHIRHVRFGSIGQAICFAVSGSIWTSDMPQELNKNLPMGSKNESMAIYGDITK